VRPVLRHTQTLRTDALPAFLATHPDTLVLDARTSQEFRQARLAQAQWVIRPTLLDKAAARNGRPLLLLGTDLRKLEFLAQDLEDAGQRDIRLVLAGAAALQAAGLPLDSGTAALPDADCIDFLFFVHDRHDGNKAAARQYLEWETGLVPRLDEQERNTFSIGH
jgi:hypothetical protein